MAENTQTGTRPTGGIRTGQIASVYDAGDKLYVQKLCKRFGKQYAPFYRWVEILGREEPMLATDDDKWYGYEENRYISGVKVLADVADPGVGNTTVFQLDPSFIGPAASGYGFYGREGETITIPGSNVQAHIELITGRGTANVFFTLKPVSATSNIGALTAGQVMSITNAAYASGTGQPMGVTTGHTKREFMTQIIKETYGLEGKEMATSQVFKTFDVNGNEVPYSVVTDLSIQTQARLDSKINGALVLGQMRTNPNLVTTTSRGATNPINYTQGLIPTIDQLGRTDTIPLGTFDPEDLDEVGIYMKSQGVTSGVAMLAVGARRRAEMENSIKDYLQGNGTDFSAGAVNSLGGNDMKDRMLSVGFSEIYKNGIHYLVQTVDDFSNPETFGRDGYNLDKEMLVLPIEKIKDARNNGKLQNNLSTRYVAKGAYSRKFEMWSQGAAGGDTSSYSGDVDEKVWYMRTHLGFQVLGANQMQRIKG